LDELPRNDDLSSRLDLAVRQIPHIRGVDVRHVIGVLEVRLYHTAFSWDKKESYPALPVPFSFSHRLISKRDPSHLFADLRDILDLFDAFVGLLLSPVEIRNGGGIEGEVVQVLLHVRQDLVPIHPVDGEGERVRLKSL